MKSETGTSSFSSNRTYLRAESGGRRGANAFKEVVSNFPAVNSSWLLASLIEPWVYSKLPESTRCRAQGGQM